MHDFPMPTTALYRFILLWILVLSTSVGAESRSGEQGPHRALLIGIGDYPQTGPRPWRRLRVGQEVALYRQVLTRHHGFRDEDILTLEDGQATGKAIREAVRRHLIDAAQPGAVLVLHFSGHGQQVPDGPDADEVDGLDESLVPAESRDSSALAGAKVNIRDDEIAGWIREIEGRLRRDGKTDGLLMITVDSCFSGSVTRGLLTERGRGWDRTLDGPQPKSKRQGPADGASGLMHVEDGTRMDTGYVLLAAAQSTQTARERDGMGVFTRSLLSELARAGASPAMTYQELYERLRSRIATDVEEQVPVLEGAAQRRLFTNSPAMTGQAPARIAAKVVGSQVVLDVGRLHGATVGSRYALTAVQATATAVPVVLPEVEVKQVSALDSVADVVPSPTAHAMPVSGQHVWASEVAHSYTAAPLKLFVPKQVARMLPTSLLAELPMVQRDEVSGASYDVRLAAERSHLALYRASFGQPFARLPWGAGLADGLTQHLRREWLWRYLGQLDHRDPGLEAHVRFVRVAARLDPVTGKVTSPPERIPTYEPAPFLSIPSGGFFQLEVTNLANRPIYVSIVELASDGSMAEIYPAGESPTNEPVAADGRPHLLRWEPYTFQCSGRVSERSRFKVLITEQPVSLAGVLASTEVRSSQIGLPKAYSALEPVLRVLHTGQRTPMLAPVGADSARWSTDDLWLEVAP